MKTLTLEESIQWMEKCIFEGADWNEDFWSNFTDALHYLREYRDALGRTVTGQRGLSPVMPKASPGTVTFVPERVKSG